MNAIWRQGAEVHFERFFGGDVSRQEFEAVFSLPGLRAELRVEYVTNLDSMKARIDWYDGEEYMGSSERRFSEVGGKRVWHGESLRFRPDYQDKGHATALYEKQVAFAGRAGFAEMSVYAAGTIGRYAWAKKGYDYLLASDKEWQTGQFVKWCRVYGIKLDEYPTFGSAYDVATFKVQGMKFIPMRNEGFRNEDVPRDMELDLGKAFMLDDRVEGHGTWQAVMKL